MKRRNLTRLQKFTRNGPFASYRSPTPDQPVKWIFLVSVYATLQELVCKSSGINKSVWTSFWH
jgi:hypothetical protein